MNKIKVLVGYDPEFIQSAIDKFVNETPDIDILSVHSHYDRVKGTNVTYILYYDKKSIKPTEGTASIVTKPYQINS